MIDRLRMALRHVEQGRAIISRQHQLIRKMQEAGRPTDSAEEVLGWMEAIQETFERHYQEAVEDAFIFKAPDTGPPEKPEPHRDDLDVPSSKISVNPSVVVKPKG